ncbi:hypothetical protein IMX26_07940 [Clostridium sp. 'deep sea']|uniref:hypothetical protein n=1 Tax=Clostridium sp. 'deep sea' TaxID=2779445 RepID=UPI0018968926|nr:hypothetical protein [Clostridium sp. 'deep sea']QOR36727.1 hypothetical protein IMX26_07940 [Clostridium sp. 'deep sea']
MSRTLVERIKDLMNEKLKILSELRNINYELTLKKTPKQLQELHNNYQQRNEYIEQLDVKVNQLIMNINMDNTRSLQHVLSFKELYNADCFGERISDISNKVLYEYNTIMNLDKILIKQYKEITKDYQKTLSISD